MYQNMINLEDFNSILAFNPDYTDQYVINCGLLPQEPFVETYYDFNILSMVQNEDNTFTYTLKVYNKMWDGGITFKRVPDNNSAPAVNTILSKNYNNEYYMLYITTTYTDFDIVLTLNNLNDNARAILSTSFNLNLSSGNELTYYYYENKSVTFETKNVNDEILPNVSISLIGDGLSLNNRTNSNGKCTINIPKLKPGIYNIKVVGTHTGLKTISTYLKLNVLKEKPTIQFETEGSYKGGYSNANIHLNLKGKPNTTINMRIFCNDNKLGSDFTTTLNYKNAVYYTPYEMSFRKVRNPNTVITCEVLETEYTENVKTVFSEPLNTKIINNWPDLKTECENVKGVDYIQIPQAEVAAGTAINITRDIDIIGQEGNTWSKFSNSTFPYLFKVYNNNLTDIVFTVVGISFEKNANGVIYADNYSHIDLSCCRFINNTKNDNIGTCIQNRIDSKEGAGTKTSTTIDNVYFINNKGACIASCGQTNINNSHFYLNEWKYAQHPQPYAIEVYYGKTDIGNSEFYINMGLTESPLPVYQVSNFSWGKVPFYVQRDAILNGKYGKDMMKDNSLNLKDNTSYVYARYVYNGIKVVASPKRNKERTAGGHVISGRNWAWKDNLRVEKRSVYDNYINHPTMNMPSNNRR